MSTPKLSPAMLAALELAYSKPSRRISSGHRFRTAPGTLRALRSRGLVVHLGSGGPYYDRHVTYRLTAEGEALAATLADEGAVS